MEWQYVILFMFVSLIVLMLTGLPIAFCFFAVNIFAGYIFFGGMIGLERFYGSMYSTLISFIFLPIPLFILMGEVLFYSGLAPILIKTLDKWMGRMPGRLSLLAVGAGTLFSTLTGTSIASVAMLGSALVPEMEQRGYKKPMTMGPIMGSGNLAMFIPPSGLAVLCGALAHASIGRLLIAIILPGLLLAALMAAYIIIRCLIQPDLAPSYEVSRTSFSVKVREFIKYILPQSIVIFLVIGVIFLGIAGPGEAAATGAMGVIVLALCYKKLSWQAFMNAVMGTVKVTGMLFLVIASARFFSEVMAFSGATAGMAAIVKDIQLSPMMIIIIMQLIVLFLGCFMDPPSIMMITIPIFIPIVKFLGFDLIWFCVLLLINIEIAMITPPFGVSLFVMKGVATKDTTMVDVYKAGFPFVLLSLLAMALIMIFPKLVMWLPGIMMRFR
ncbi:MAG: TRAP transporter large permease subunit [Deltaproteobacteria bacterium]|nr:TRAP transporter large permease subunit [Deltaproteobacteria bacterium]